MESNLRERLAFLSWSWKSSNYVETFTVRSLNFGLLNDGLYVIVELGVLRWPIANFKLSLR